jgi:hypothetical protein
MLEEDLANSECVRSRRLDAGVGFGRQGRRVELFQNLGYAFGKLDGSATRRLH